MLQVRLLGQFDILLDGKRVVIPSRAAQSLFAFLILSAGTAHRREKLAGTFWPDTSDENARKNLRQELWRIRKAISAQQSAEGDTLLADEFTLTFNREADYWLDVDQIEKPDLDLQALLSNLALYEGELLPGFYDDWIALERERLQTVYETKMGQLLDQLIAAERWLAVQEWGERWLTLGHTPEPAYRALMLAYGVRGDMAKVVSIYQRCTADLREQLGVEPSAETRALYDGLLKGSKAPLRTATVQTAGTVTFFFTDIEGSTRLLDKLGDQYATALAEHHAILREAIQKWNGREVDTQGDAFFVTFARALDAVQCAGDAQRALDAHVWTQGEPVRVRMGLHTGEPLVASTGYVGMDVHRAARIGDAAHGGQVLLSQTTRELVLQDLPPGLAIRDLGEFRLKDMKYPVPVYQLVIDGLLVEFPPLRTKFSGTEAPTAGEAPFKGLQYFDERDADLFFGRELLTAKLVKRLRESDFLSVIIGASGSGKSSLVRAGLVPALKKGDALLDGTKLPVGSADWQVYIITPTAHPLEALAAELTRDSESVTATASLIDDLTKDPRSLHLALVRQIAACDSSAGSRHTLLVIDQFEELFTLCRDEFEREAFIDNLLTAISPAIHGTGRGEVTLILTLRADFYAHLAQYPELREAVARQQEYIGPMTPDELRRTIEEPAKRGRWEFEPGLIDLILRDVGDEPGALPLLSHALLETWKRRAGHTLTLKGYADAGGVRGAIAHTAESAYQNLSPDEQLIARNIFLRLTELGEGTEDTRRRASFDELMSQTEEANRVRAVLNILAEARLVTLSEDTAEVAHEALIREWPTLREWLNQDREGLQLHRRLTEAAHDWELLGRDAGSLYRGAHLAQAREWAEANPRELNVQEQAFLNASNELKQREEAEREAQLQRELAAAQKLAETEHAHAQQQTRSANRLRLRNRVITAVGAMAIVLAVIAGVFSVQSNQNATTAQLNAAQAVNAQATAQSASTLAEQQRAAAVAAQANAVSNAAISQDLALVSASQAALANGHADQAIALALQAVTLDPLSHRAQAALSEAAYVPGTIRRIAIPDEPDGRFSISPDGLTILIAGGASKQVFLMDVPTGKIIRRFDGHTDYVNNVAFSPDGRTALSASDDKTLILWDVQTGALLRRFAGHTAGINAVAFSPDGHTAISAGALGDNTLILWDVQTGKILHQLIGHSSGVRDIAFSPDGRTALSASRDMTLILWDVQTGTLIRRFKGHTGFVNAVVFSADGRTALSAANGGTLILWDVETGQVIRRFFYQGDINDVAFSADGHTALSADEDGTLILWDVATGQSINRFQGGGPEGSVAISRDGQTVVSSTDNGGTLQLWDVTGGQVIRRFAGQTQAVVWNAAISPAGLTALTGSDDGSAILWNLQTSAEIRRYTNPNGKAIHDVKFSPDGRTALIATGDTYALDPADVILWNVETGQEIRRFVGHQATVYGVSFSSDGRTAVSSDGKGFIILWDVTTGQEIRRFQGYENDSSIEPFGVTSVAFSPDGRTLLTGFGTGKLILWDVATGQEIRQFVGHTNIVNNAIFSLDGQGAFSGSWDGTAIYWDVVTGSIIHRFTDHSGAVFRVQITPDGRFGLAGSADNKTLLWDLNSGDVIRRYTGPDAGPFSLALSSDGRTALVGNFNDGGVALWRIDSTLDELVNWTRANRYIPDLTCDQRTLYQLEPLCPQVTATPAGTATP